MPLYSDHPIGGSYNVFESSRRRGKTKQREKEQERAGRSVVQSACTRPLRLIRLRAVSPASRVIASRDITSRPISLMATSRNHHAHVCFFRLFFLLSFIFTPGQNELARTGQTRLNNLFFHLLATSLLFLFTSRASNHPWGSSPVAPVRRGGKVNIYF